MLLKSLILHDQHYIRVFDKLKILISNVTDRTSVFEKIEPLDFRRSNGLVVKTLDSQSRGPLFKTTGWLQGRLSTM